MTQRYKSTAEDDRILQDESAGAIDRVSAMSRIGFDMLYEFEPLLAELLHHSSYHLRAEAVKVLLSAWKKSEYVDDAVQMLHADPEWEPRADAAFALSSFARATKHQTEMIVRELARCLTQDDDWKVQEGCYLGLQEILTSNTPSRASTKKFNRDRDVDWELLKPYLDQQAV